MCGGKASIWSPAVPRHSQPCLTRRAVRTQGVALTHGGVNGYDYRPAVGVFDLGLDGLGSYLKGCAVSVCYNVGVQIRKTAGLELSDNVVFSTLGSR